MRKHVLYLLLFLPCLGIGQQVCDSAIRPFQPGEEILYTVYYNWKFVWIPAGQVRFTMSENPDHIEFEVIGKSFPSYDSFFQVDDRYVSKVEKTSLLPYQFVREVHEGSYHRYDSLSMDQETFAVKEYFGKTKETAREFNFQLDKVMHDMVSVIYYLRTIPIETYQPGNKIPVHIFFDKEEFDLDVNFLGMEKKKIRDLGKFDTYHLQPELIDGYVFKEGDLMDIWLSSEGNRLPLLIESPISYGSIKAVLTRTKGTKYELE